MIPNLSKEMIDLMQQLRKRLRCEFGVEIKLSQADIVQTLLGYVEKSKDQKSLLLFADLEDLMGITLPRSQSSDASNTQSHSAPVAKSSKRIYRGQVIEDAPMAQASAASAPKRIYRGQVVA